LYDSLGNQYNIPPPNDPGCQLCNHKRIDDINNLIRSRNKRQTWKQIIRILRDDFGLALSTIQCLISHEKYHM
jgi:hypothetical protein